MDSDSQRGAAAQLWTLTWFSVLPLEKHVGLEGVRAQTGGKGFYLASNNIFQLLTAALHAMRYFE